MNVSRKFPSLKEKQKEGISIKFATKMGDLRKKFYIGHGDGLGPGDYGYKFIKRVFANPFLQWCFARLHPNLGIGLADFLSKRSRAKTGHKDAVLVTLETLSGEPLGTRSVHL